VVVLAVVAVFATLRADDGKTASPGTGTTDTSFTPSDASVAGVAVAGTKAPGFDLPKLRGPGRVRLADYLGKPLIVNFWASYCGPCRKEFPLFREMQAKYRQQGLQIVGITYKDLPGDARRFANQHHATWALAPGGDGDPVGRAYGVRANPQTFFIDRDGTIVQRFYGGAPTETFNAAVQKIVGT
jgi:cytochrome c biogenesis protein CcmG, thiol:disulfide interchange protein DsbE